MEDELKHYGVIGMKWGIRRTPEQLGHAPRAERRQFKKQLRADSKKYRSMRRDVTATQREVKSKTRVYDRDAKQVEKKEIELYRARGKTVLPWNKKKKEDLVRNCEEHLNEALMNSEPSERKRRQAVSDARKAIDDMDRFIADLNKRYGSENVKQLRRKDITNGKIFTRKVILENGRKVGVNAANIPVIGNMISATILSKYDSQRQAELLKKRTDNYRTNRYA